MTRTLVVTNDFPPRAGGIEAFVAAMVRELHAREPGSVVVHTRAQPGDAEHDANLGHPVVRERVRVMLPTRALTASVTATAAEHACERVWFGAAAPLGLMAPALRAVGVTRTVATTHGHEVWWARLPGLRSRLRAVVARNDVTTVLTAATGAAIAAGLRPGQEDRLATLSPGIDPETFAPTPRLEAAAQRVRARHGLLGRPVVLCLSRLAPRKGQDVLVAAWPTVMAAVPGAALLLAGSGPSGRRLERAVAAAGLDVDVVLTGAVAPEELSAHHAAADVFAMPCRDRFAGLETEGFGICFLEAAASARPVVAGRSGGTPEAVDDGVDALLVDGRDVAAVAGAVIALLSDPRRAAAMGAAGLARVTAERTTAASGRRLARLLDL